MQFREREWPITLALALPRWLSPVAVWLINRETRRAERYLNPPAPSPRADPYGIGTVGAMMGGLLGASASKKAAIAQRAAMQAHLDLQRREFEASRANL